MTTPCLTFEEPASGSRCRACGGTRREHEGCGEPWGVAHLREAVARAYELAAELVREGRPTPAAELLECPWLTAQKERTWRADLSCGLDPARIDREVRRVRALAEGRLMRETVWAGTQNRARWDFDSREAALSWVRAGVETGASRRRLVQLIRIRRAP